jgi:class 3 adenylate cyclase/tetratricopeptide (TPR) repeat protein
MATTAPLLTCTVCSTTLLPSAKFCSECGQPVAGAAGSPPRGDFAERIRNASAAVEGERKLVTVLFADLKGSMALMADRDPEEARRLLDPVLEHMCDAVEQYGGTISQVMGDGIMALFGAPLAAEDHAVRACHAALGMQDLVRHYGDELQRSHGVPIQIRVGLNSGDVVLRMSGHGLHVSYTAVGMAVHLASRMEQMAKPGSVLATADTVRMAGGHIETRSIGPVKVKGFERPIDVAEIHRASTTRSRFDARPSRTMTPFLGRNGELQTMLRAFAQVEANGPSQIIAIVGEAGIGKSRLVYEFYRAIAGKNVLALDGGAAPYGSGAGYRPGVHILRQFFGIAENDDAKTKQEKVAGKIVALNGATTAAVFPLLSMLDALPADNAFHGLSVKERRQQVVDALMWLGRRVTAERPMVLAYEDLQWVTSDTRNWLERLTRELPTRTLVLLTYRTDYDARALTVPGTIELRLDGLVPQVTRRLISGLIGDDASLDALKEELPSRSGGNPLFVEEHLRSMIDAGVLQGKPGNYRMGSSPDRIDIPQTVRAVLAARIDRLVRTDKHVLQALAAFGESATIGLLGQVSGVTGEDLRLSLRRLQASDLLIERAEREVLAYEFRHALTQAVAYDTLLHERRRELHRAILRALKNSPECDVLARHALLAEAWDEAFSHLREAGRIAAAHFAQVEAVAHYERALSVIPHLPSTRATIEAAIDIRCDLRNALVPLGRHLHILQHLRDAEELAAGLHDEHRLATILSFVSNCYGNIGRADLALGAAQRSLQLGERAGDAAMLVSGNLSVGEIHRTLGDYRRARTHLNRVLELIPPEGQQQRLGQVGLPSVRARSHLAWTLAELGDFVGAHAAAEEAVRLADASEHSYSIAHACLALGGTRLRQGEFQAAIPILMRGLAATERVPLLRPPIAADLGVAHARMGNIAAGLSHLNAAVDAARRMGRLSRLPLILVKCGEIHLLAGEAAEACRLAETALALALQQRERGNEVYARHLLGELHALGAPADDAVAKAKQSYHDALNLALELGMEALTARCNAALGALYARTGQVDAKDRHVAVAQKMYRAMGMRFWLEKLEADVAPAS